MAKTSKLNARQQQFVKLYCSDPEVKYNGTACYRKMYPNKKTSYENVRYQASELLTNPNVAKAIEKYHLEADRAAEQRLISWKKEAVESQRVWLDIRDKKNMPMEDVFSVKGQKVGEKPNVPLMRLQADICSKIIERAYPAKLGAMFERIAKKIEEEEAASGEPQE